jgi:ATP-binding protein involved in chromosome partitioning
MDCSETINDRQAEEALKAGLDRIGHISIVLSGKGGVGKNAVAVNQTLSLSSRGMRTGILDVDMHGPSMSKLLGLAGRKVGISNEETVYGR